MDCNKENIISELKNKRYLFVGYLNFSTTNYGYDNIDEKAEISLTDEGMFSLESKELDEYTVEFTSITKMIKYLEKFLSTDTYHEIKPIDFICENAKWWNKLAKEVRKNYRR